MYGPRQTAHPAVPTTGSKFFDMYLDAKFFAHCAFEGILGWFELFGMVSGRFKSRRNVSLRLPVLPACREWASSDKIEYEAMISVYLTFADDALRSWRI